MNRPITSLILCLLFSIPAQAADKYALLIGVTRYEHSRMNDVPLKFPEADAAAVGDLLKESGYTVDSLLGRQATRSAIQKALEKAAQQGTADGALVIGVFGHGVQYGQDAYFCPYDGKVRQVVDPNTGNKLRDKNGQVKLEPDPISLVSLKSILDTVTTCGAGNKIILADCCREDPSAARGRAFGSELKISDLPRGTAALFSCSESEKAFEHDDWGHGAFTYAFLEQCRRQADIGKVRANGISGPVYDRVEELVIGKTSGRSHQTVNPIINGIVDLQLELTGPDILTNSIGMKLKLIPAGEFLMGSPESEQGRSDDEHQHRVRITQPFYLGVTEVTQGQWTAVMGTEPWKGEDYVREGADFPATYVSWEDAVEYCKRLTSREGVTYRLPTEAEWEYACRGGTTTRFHFGSSETSLGDYAWFDGNAWDVDEKYAHLVRQKRPNGFGLYDMHGNVWEWCQDEYDAEYYKTSSAADPRGPSESSGGSRRVYRGGCWYDSPQGCRSAHRGGYSPSSRHGDLGFRVLRSSVK
ncbi:MAG: SUMF1/EgtB/PvdO family nonheme iron enzyme [Planctomycetaceae bacterium]|nr:SUMF1/EgtB/PvdO family nonheme iron enzyme [Planctomycetaceae bacterium]